MTIPGPRHPLRLADHALGLLLGVAFVVALLATTDLGFVRDEGYYFRAAYQYLGWFKELASNLSAGDWGTSFTQSNIDKHWAFNQEHPVFIKALFSLSYWLFHETLGWMSPSTAMRFPAMLSAGVLVQAVYLFGASVFGRWQGAFAAVALIAMPRPFFHAHLACFDYPVMTLWFLVMAAWYRGLRSTGWGWITGIMLGLGLSVKHNIFFVPVTLGMHWVLVYGDRLRMVEAEGKKRLQLPPLPVAFVSMAVLGPLVWHLLWPSHWFDTWDRIVWYFQFHLKHVHYFQYYFGENLYAPPFPVAFPFVLSATTLPPVTMLATLFGSLVLAQRWLRSEEGLGLLEPLRRRVRATLGSSGPVDPRGTGWWLALGAFVPFAVIAVPSTPVFGGIKHWMPAMPFLALLAGVGAVAAGKALVDIFLSHRVRDLALATVLAMLLAPAIWATAHTHPNGTAFYNVLVGGPRGAADKGMMRQFWGYAGYEGLSYVNENTKKNARVYFQNTNQDSYRMYQREGQLRKDIRNGGMQGSQMALFHHQMAFQKLETDIWKHYHTRNPAFVGDIDGVPVLSIYPMSKQRLKPKPSKPKPKK